MNSSRPRIASTEYIPDNYEKAKELKVLESVIPTTATTEYIPDNYEKMKQMKPFELPFSNSSVRFGLDNHGILMRLKSYQSTYPNGTIKVARSRQANLGDIKHHVFFLKLFNKWRKQYRAFCAGSIITEQRVLTSAQCFYTNRKRLRHQLPDTKVAGGLLCTVQTYPSVNNSEQQWRTPVHVYTQKFYRFPAYSLAVVQLDQVWEFNDFINKIPYAKTNRDYDGVCTGTIVKITKSWAYKKYLFTDQYRIVPRQRCERMLLRTCMLYICTIGEEGFAESETAGAGLVCFETGVPEEDSTAGLLVGVTVLINIGLPSLHHRVSLFHEWVTDGAIQPEFSGVVQLLLICLIGGLYLKY